MKPEPNRNNIPGSEALEIHRTIRESGVNRLLQEQVVALLFDFRMRRVYCEFPCSIQRSIPSARPQSADVRTLRSHLHGHRFCYDTRRETADEDTSYS